MEKGGDDWRGSFPRDHSLSRTDPHRTLDRASAAATMATRALTVVSPPIARSWKREFASRVPVTTTSGCTRRKREDEESWLMSRGSNVSTQTRNETTRERLHASRQPRRTLLPGPADRTSPTVAQTDWPPRGRQDASVRHVSERRDAGPISKKNCVAHCGYLARGLDPCAAFDRAFLHRESDRRWEQRRDTRGVRRRREEGGGGWGGEKGGKEWERRGKERERRL